MFTGAVDELLDAENKRLTENLTSKVSKLRSNSNFLSATGLLTGSVKRFSTMVGSGRDHRRILLYVSVGLVLLFFLLYSLLSRIS
uniref:BET1-like protein n=1 Tax=Gouania willdenowi TaxID=441366 RepID=A0A8C5HYT5_GOUWI